MAFSDITPDTTLIKLALACKCPKCGKGSLYNDRYSMTVKPACDHCGLNLSDHDAGDGPAVFLIFILGFMLVPLALAFEWAFAPPLWLHGVIWTIVALSITLGSLKPLKAYIIALQYKHRPGDWKNDNENE